MQRSGVLGIRSGRVTVARFGEFVGNLAADQLFVSMAVNKYMLEHVSRPGKFDSYTSLNAVARARSGSSANTLRGCIAGWSRVETEWVGIREDVANLIRELVTPTCNEVVFCALEAAV